MQMRVMLGVALGIVFLSGCAGPRTAQEINRLKSDVGLLDQRVSQLERTIAGQASSALPIESQIQPATTAQTASKPPTALSLKPSTSEIQQALKNAGFYQGPIDGKLGPLTREAIMEFQRINGLKVDGVAGKQTWSKLQPYLDLSAASGEPSAAEPLK